jgi:hypothetical protein
LTPPNRWGTIDVMELAAKGYKRPLDEMQERVREEFMGL